MILACNHIEKKFNDEALFSDVSFHINEHECTALVGVNGTGKTTLLRIIVGELPADNGDVILAKDTSVGYLPQQQGYHSDKSIYDELWEVKKDIVALEREIRTMEETMQTASGEELNPLLERYHRMQTEFEAKDGYACKSQIMGIINGLGFVGNDIDKSINTLSGGQKTRVALGKLLLLEPDLLILDEPTNHLDLASREWIEEAVEAFDGTLLFVSHDRYFVERFATRVLYLENGHLTDFIGSYSAFLDWRAKGGGALPEAASAPAPKKKKAAVPTLDDVPKPPEKPKRTGGTKNLQKLLNTLEREISQLETQSSDLEQQMVDAASDSGKLLELMTEKEACDEKLAAKMDEWEAVAAELEELQ